MLKFYSSFKILALYVIIFIDLKQENYFMGIF